MKSLGECSLRRFWRNWGTQCFLVSICIGCIWFYSWSEKQSVYNSIDITLGSNKTIEYGTDYNPLDLVQKATGNVRVISSKVDTHKIGEGEVVFEVEKDEVVKQIAVRIKVSDTTPPEIVLKNDMVSIYVGDSYNLTDNIVSVKDTVDGDLPFKEKEESNSYTFLEKPDLSKVGTYSIVVKAQDGSGNEKEATFKVEVKEKPIVTVSKPPSGDRNALVTIARSLLGSPYVSGGNGPSGFDCSGFVSYVYGRVGLSIPRSTTGQLGIGTSVSRENMVIGDILVWSANGSSPTHTGIYIGNGQMIHAANPRKGVIISSVSSWPETLISIRRI